jgi:hypothetical protein
MAASDLILWGIGLVVAVVLALWGAKTITNRNQSQNAAKGSIAIQSGRDTKINDDK